MRKKRGQIWVETMIYTLIAFTMISAVLFFVKPKIEELQDKTLTEQSVEVIKEIDQIIEELAQSAPGNKREITLSIRKGEFRINSSLDQISFEIKSKYQFSEPDQTIQEGDINITTQEETEINIVTILRKYDSYNLTYQGKENPKTISKASTPYKLFISNKGSNPINIDLEVT